MTTLSFFKCLIVLFAMLTLGACSESKSSETVYPFPTYETSNELKKEIDPASLSCESTGCDARDFESIGLVGMLVEGNLSDYTYKMGQCTGFLYGANDIVALNSHCISDSMWAHRQDCAGYLGIKFTEMPGHPSEVFMCEEIIYRSDLSKENAGSIKPDYAFFRIKPTSRKPLNLSGNALNMKELITVRKINPLRTERRLGGLMDYAYCQIQNESLLNTNFANEWSETALGINPENGNRCKIIQGNSGSPVLNSKKEIIGFAQSYLTADFLKVLKSEAVEKALSANSKVKLKMTLPEKIPDHFQFTQTICAKSPKNITTDNDICRIKSQSMLAASDENEILSGYDNAKDLKEYVDKLKSDTLKQYPEFMLYDLEKEANAYVYSVVPRCMLPVKKWNQNAIDMTTSILTGTTKSVRTLTKPTIFELNVTLNFDKNLVLKTKTIGHTALPGRFLTTVTESQILVYRSRQNSNIDFQETLEKMNTITWCQ